MFQLNDIFAWGVMMSVSIVGVMLMIRVIRSALGARGVVAAVQAAASRFIQSDEYRLDSLLQEITDPKARQSLSVLGEIASGANEAIRDRIGDFVDAEFGGPTLRGLNVCARMLPFAGLFGTVLGLLAQFHAVGESDGKNLDLSAVGLALRSTAAALFGTMALLAVGSSFGEPALRRVKRAYLQAAYRCHEHCRLLREANRPIAEKPAAVAASAPSRRAKGLEAPPSPDRDTEDDDPSQEQSIYNIKPEPSNRNHRPRQVMA